ncbi:Aste57867_12062 [Aphanomyces stellatus]|uniref:Aste57867_12062 protein n=1 Tax=Aphanomyces stellatus TaxID=120398 RepID=A0A485KV12_9STRA|nr:hypothetical protein As57867_012017 [Aphanomyces stellatus]VFT88917.1 Aste57867_12062 [Aphanomyces stellatus]
MFATASTHSLLDDLDEARATLAQEEDLIRAVPSFVVAGMQSAGKSAVLSRISGVPFPQDSGLCTRVAIELSMRRCRAGDAPNVTITANDEELPGDDHAALLLEAQTLVLGGKKFECHKSVKIAKQGPHCPEVTLIDLPGLFCAKSHDESKLEEMVKSLVTQHVVSEMALILHVIPINQDTDTISSWRVVNEADPDRRRTIFIFTKADLVPTKAELQRRIQKILRKEGANGAEVPYSFIVHGDVASVEAETAELAHVLMWMDELALDNVSVGIDGLNRHLEERMLAHTRQHLPELRAKLKAELQKCRATLDKLGRVPLDPSTVVLKGISAMAATAATRFRLILPKLRTKFEAMAVTIHGMQMEPLGNVVTPAEVADALAQVSFHAAPQQASINVEAYSIATPWVAQLLTMALEAKEIANKSRAMHNKLFEGTLLVLQAWTLRFATAAHETMTTFVDDVFDFVKLEVVAAVSTSELESSVPTTTTKTTKKPKPASIQDAMERMAVVELMARLEATRAEALDACAHVHAWNVGPDLFTTDEIYLDAKAAPSTAEAALLEVALSDESRAEWSAHLETVLETRGFLAVQKKLVGDVVQREVVRILRKFVMTGVMDVLTKNAGAMVAATRESPAIESRRRGSLAREVALAQTLDMLAAH